MVLFGIQNCIRVVPGLHRKTLQEGKIEETGVEFYADGATKGGRGTTGFEWHQNT